MRDFALDEGCEGWMKELGLEDLIVNLHVVHVVVVVGLVIDR